MLAQHLGNNMLRDIFMSVLITGPWQADEQAG
jgi:hypothetical protein